MRKKLFVLLAFLASALPAVAGPEPDPRVERIKAQLLNKPVFAQFISKLQIADFQGVVSATAGCAPNGQARAFYDPNLNQFKVLDSGCNNLIVSSGGTASPFPWNQLLNPNGNKNWDFGGASFGFANGAWDWGTMTLRLPHSAGATVLTDGQVAYDSTAGNLLFFGGFGGIVGRFNPADSLTDGSIVGLSVSVGGQVKLVPAPSNSPTGTSVLQVTTVNPKLGDSTCILDLGPPIDWENCTPGIPINLQTGTTYTYTGDDRGAGVISNNASAQAYSLPLLAEANDMAANFFWFQLNKNTGTVTITASGANVFDSTGTANETILEGENVSFLTDDSTGKIYPKFSPGRVTVTSPIVGTRSPYGIAISCPTCGTTGGTLTSPHVPVATGGSALADSTITDDGTNPTRAPKGVNTAAEGNYEEYTVDTGGVTAGLALCVTNNVDGAGRPKVLPCNHLASQPGAGFVGIAKSTVVAGSVVSVCWTVNCSATFDNASTSLNEAILSITTDGRLHDTGSQSATTGQPNFSVLNSNAGTGTNSLISLTGMLAQNPKGGGGNGKGAGYNTIDSNGSAVTQRSIVNFIPAGSANVSCVDNPGSSRTDCTVTGINGPPSPTVNTVAGTTYTISNSDNSWRDVFTNTSTVAVTLPQAGSISASPFIATRLNTGNNCNPCTTAGFTVGSGDLLVAAFRISDSSVASGVATVTDSAGNTWHRLQPDQTSGNLKVLSVWYTYPALASGSNVMTITMTGGTTVLNWVVDEYSITALDHFNQNTGASGVPSTTSIPVSFSQEVALAFQNDDGALGCSSSWTARGSAGAGVIAICERLLASSASVAYTTLQVGPSSMLQLADYGISSTPVFAAGWYVILENKNSPLVTVTPTTSTINVDGVAKTSLVIPKGRACSIMSDGTNYDATCWGTTLNLTTAIHQTAQTGSISTATLCAASPGACDVAGQYHVYFDFIETGTACSNVTAGSVTFNLTWTDSNGTAHSAVVVPVLNQTGASSMAQANAFTFATSLANASASGNLNISTNGSVIQYSTTYTACTTGTGTYQLDAIVTKLQY